YPRPESWILDFRFSIGRFLRVLRSQAAAPLRARRKERPCHKIRPCPASAAVVRLECGASTFHAAAAIPLRLVRARIPDKAPCAFGPTHAPPNALRSGADSRCCASLDTPLLTEALQGRSCSKLHADL